MSSFLSSLADKAQSALGNSPLAQHIPHARTDSQQAEPGSGIGHGSRTLESISHQIRTIQQQYSSSTTPAQKIITSEKGLALGFDNISRGSQGFSKELYTWGQTEPEDLKDVTDRLAWLNYIQGSLANTLATKIDAARAPFKALRDAETKLAPRRNIRNALDNQIGRIEHEQQRGAQQKLTELRLQLHKAEAEDESLEKEIEILKRKAVRESEQLKWAAMREYAEKLVLVSQAASAVIPALPPIPPSKAQPYTGAQTTASVRASLQKALDDYTPGSVTLVLGDPSASDLKRSDTRSFGETHATELSRIDSSDPSAHPSIPVTPPPTTGSNFPAQPQRTTPAGPNASGPAGSANHGNTSSAPLNPAALNQSPAPIPASGAAASLSPVVVPDLADPTLKLPSVTPTVAETGIPKSAGPDGPGPASGSLLDKSPSSMKSPSDSPLSITAAAGQPQAQVQAEEGLPGYGGSETSQLHESAADEKKRLEREYRERVLREGGTSSEEQKRWLEKEERQSGSGDGGGDEKPPAGDGDLPPYQEF